jgi:hypothetical protein
VKNLMVLVLFLGTASVAAGAVSTRVCEADGNTPFDDRDIMVGTRLTIIVSSDTAEYWWGGLFIADPYRDYGLLYGRDYNSTPPVDWEGSHFPAAGPDAQVLDWEDDDKTGFQLLGDIEAVAGDWFIIDYNATDIGDCNVGYYDFDVSWDDPIYGIPFYHVRTRDFNADTIVDLADFAILGSYWQQTDCNDPNWCEGTDLDTTGNIDANDLMLFVDYWLETTQ